MKSKQKHQLLRFVFPLVGFLLICFSLGDVFPVPREVQIAFWSTLSFFVFDLLLDHFLTLPYGLLIPAVLLIGWAEQEYHYLAGVGSDTNVVFAIALLFCAIKHGCRFCFQRNNQVSEKQSNS